jgi:4-aminobutyrate aminotransferase-like enzyme/Ser/Thr protein kinase RdoA (MazF antagonist)
VTTTAAVQATKYIGANPPSFPAETATRVARDVFGVTGGLVPIWGERDQNFAVLGESGPAFVLKISNERQTPEELDLQLQAMTWMARTDPGLSVPRLHPTLAGQDCARVTGPSGTAHLVHMLTHLGGVPLAQAPGGPASLRAAGAQAGRAARALSGFHHPAAGYRLFWDLRHIGAMIRYAPLIRDRALARKVEEIAARFAADILPALERLRAQVIHHDTSPSNVLVDPADSARVTGLVDFGDVLHGPLVQDAATAALELASAGPALIDDAAAVIAGYDSVLPLDEAEINLVPDLMITRTALGLLIGATRIEQGVVSEQDFDYRELYAPVLDTFLTAGQDAIRGRLRQACLFPPHTPAPPVTDGRNAAHSAALLARRHAVLGKGLPLTYANPLHTEKGAGTWLYDVDGRPHLDCYNNVAHVGHCHPHVVRTIARQAATLNTNARYLFENVVTYAERLGVTMPGDLGVCLFVNSGSEAVDLALRLADAVTGQSGKIAIEHAYHGITVESHAISPANDWGAPGGNARPHVSQLRPDIALLENPDTLRGRFRADDPGAAEGYAADADRAIAALQAAGHPAGALVVDSAFGSHGILDVPPGYVASVARRVRAAGGLVIADEVQYGFGRSGSHFWGFGLHDLVPDIVTLGKPIGNGIALGCVVTTPQIMARFSEGNEFFSTFGGNPVACAAAHAVLDVMEAEGLQENARLTGAYLRDGLRALAQDAPCIGAVTGAGLFLGVDIVTDRTDMVPDGARADAIKNHLREAGILIGTEGFHGNVLKIRPPMVFSRPDADILLNGLRDALNEN